VRLNILKIGGKVLAKKIISEKKIVCVSLKKQNKNFLDTHTLKKFQKKYFYREVLDR
jgi:hypothetical protein